MQAELCHSQIERAAPTRYPVRMALNIQIRELRKAKGLTIAELASIVGVSTPHMSEVERGKKNLNNHLMTRIADALEVPPSDLISEPDEMARLTSALRQLGDEDRQKVEAFAAALLRIQRDGDPV
jgi:transcriptional regulator with XRE-family HTH domain